MESDYSYGCVIDAGSSGSRIYVYRWLSKQNSSPITKYFSHESSPGISNADNGVTALQELISVARSSLPVDVEDVPIFFGATAGMRILNPQKEKSIMNEIRSMLHQSGFLFRDEWARTISGEEEGAYGWLVANYLKNGARLPGRRAEATYGAIDLGGASVQVSFRPTGAILANLFPLRVDRREYSLYSHSYFYYGVDQANLQYHLHHLNNSDSISPCYPIGYTDHEMGISGSGKWHECLVKVAVLFDKTHGCYHGDRHTNRCSFNGVYQPPLENKRFIAMSAFVYTWNFLGLKTGSNTDDLRKMAKKAQEVCGMSYSEQIEYYNDLTLGPNERQTKNIHVQCFNAAYQYHLLRSGFGLPARHTSIEALGMMLVERNKGSCELSGQRSTILKINSTSDTIDYKILFFSFTPTLLLIIIALGLLLQRARRKQKIFDLLSQTEQQFMSISA